MWTIQLSPYLLNRLKLLHKKTSEGIAMVTKIKTNKNRIRCNKCEATVKVKYFDNHMLTHAIVSAMQELVRG